jgi:hypothetical protein
MFSAVHPTTDIAKILRHVRFAPCVDGEQASVGPTPRLSTETTMGRRIQRLEKFISRQRARRLTASIGPALTRRDHFPFAFRCSPADADADSRMAFSRSVGVDSRARLDSLTGPFLFR